MVWLVLSHVLLLALLCFYVNFMWEMTTLTSVSLKNWVFQEIATWIIPFSFKQRVRHATLCGPLSIGRANLYTYSLEIAVCQI
jgi:hypothetical protein